jgi:hypothetical protein
MEKQDSQRSLALAFPEEGAANEGTQHGLGLSARSRFMAYPPYRGPMADEETPMSLGLAKVRRWNHLKQAWKPESRLSLTLNVSPS